MMAGFLLLSLTCREAGAEEPQDAVLAGWARLRLEATKFLVASAQSDVERWPSEGSDASSVVHVRTVLRYFGSRRDHHAFSVRPEGWGVPAHWMEIDPGKRAREVTVSRGGRLHLRRFDPPPGRDVPWDGRWAEARSETKDLALGPESPGPCAGPFDPWSFLAHLRCLVEEPAPFRFQLFSNDGVHAVIAEKRGEERLSLELRDLEDGTTAERTLRVVRVELLPAPGGPVPSVFGMNGGLSLLIDPASGALVEITGRLEKVPGTVRFRLTGYSVRGRPRPAIPWPGEAANASALP